MTASRGPDRRQQPRRHEDLYDGTQADNMADARARRRTAFGSRNPRAKLTKADVVEIRRRASAGEIHRELAAYFDVTRSTVSEIVRREKWAWLIEEEVR